MTTGARVGAAILGIFVTGALFAPWITPVGPSDVTDVVTTRFLAPLTLDQFGVFHLLGTDRLGRDVWSRLVHGARISVLVAALATAVSLVLGVIMGGLAAILRGWPSRLVLGVTDFALALPRVVILLLLAALWQPSATLVVLTLGLTGWMPIARLTYGEALMQLERPYTESARALGASRARVFVRHVLPNAASPLLAAATLGIGNAITLEAGLSFLGLGVQPPASSWGTLIASGRDTIVNAPWVGLVPGVALVTVVVAATLVANWFELDRTRAAS